MLHPFVLCLQKCYFFQAKCSFLRLNRMSLKKIFSEAEKEVEAEICLHWWPIVVAGERPELFGRAIGNLSQAWSPQGLTIEYPLDVVLGLEREARLSRLELTVLQRMTPYKVDVKLGQGRGWPLDYERARQAIYFDAGSILFEKPPDDVENIRLSRKFQRGHLEFDEQDQRRFRFVWLVFHGPHHNNNNIEEDRDEGKISVADLKIFGLEEQQNRNTKRRRFRHLFTDDFLGSDNDNDDEEEEKSDEQWGEAKLSELLQKRSESDDNKIWQKYKSTSDLADLEEMLEEQKRRARKEGKQVRTMALEMALQQLHSCQSILTSLRVKHTRAMAEGNSKEADRLQGEIQREMDRFVRKSQLDLFLDIDDTKSNININNSLNYVPSTNSFF